MKINKNAVLVGTDGTELKVLSHVNNHGNCVVKVLKVGEYFNDTERPTRKGDIIKGINIYHGLVQFTEKGSGVFYTPLGSTEKVAA